MNMAQKGTIWIIISFLLVGVEASGGSVINQELPIRGLLKTSAGVAIPDGTYRMKFDLKQSGGSPFWSKTYPAVSVQYGVFSVNLSGNDDTSIPLTPSLLNLPDTPPGLYTVVDVYLDGLHNNTFSQSFLGIPLNSVPSSFAAGQANSALATADLSVTTDSIVDDSVTTPKLANASIPFSKFDGSGANTGDLLQWNGSTWAPTSNTVASIAGISPANLGSSVASIGTATSSNTSDTMVIRDSFGNFTASTVTATLLGSGTGDVQGDLIGNVTGNLVGAVTGSASGNVLRSGDSMSGPLILSADPVQPLEPVTRQYQDNAFQTKQNAFGYVPLRRLADTATGSLKISPETSFGLGVLSTAEQTALASTLSTSDRGKVLFNSDLQQVYYWNGSAFVPIRPAGNYITGLSGDVTATGPPTGGLASGTVNSIGGVSAAQIASNLSQVNAATTAAGANKLVKRDEFGNFSTGTITATWVGFVAGTASGNVRRAGDSMSGLLVLTGNPTLNLEIASKDYVDTQSLTQVNSFNSRGGAVTLMTGDIASALSYAPLSRSGDSMSGSLILHANPTSDNQPATKNYVDLSLTSKQASGNYITALTGDISATGPTQGGSAVATLNSVGGVNAATIVSGVGILGAATTSNTPDTILVRDALGNVSTGTLTATLNGNAVHADTAGSIISFLASLGGEVTGNQNNTVINSISGISAANVATQVGFLNTATNINSVNSLVRRDASGNFAAGTLTADLLGNAAYASSAGSASNFSGSLNGDVTGTGLATLVSEVGGQSAAQVAAGISAINAATHANVASALVKRDPLGNFSAGTITATLLGNATSANNVGTVPSFTGSFNGDVTGTQSASVVTSVGGVTAAQITSGLALASEATQSNVGNTLVLRDSSGGFNAEMITAALNGSAIFASVAGSASSFSGSMAGDVSGTQSSTSVNQVGGLTIANLILGINQANSATSANIPGTLLKRNSAGDFSAGTISANLSGNASFAPTAVSATQFSGSFAGNVTGTQSSTSVTTVGGLSAASVAAGMSLANNATASNASGTMVKRNTLGNFSAGTVSATLLGNASSATSASTFSASFSGDLTGTQGATSVSSIGGVSASNVASGANSALAATNTNTPNSLVRRDGSGNLSAGTVTANLVGNAATATVAISASTFTGSLAGNVTGTQSATQVATVGGVGAASLVLGTNAALGATNANTAGTLVRRDFSGNFSAGTLTATLSGNATFASTAGSASSFSGAFTGDMVGTQAATTVSGVGGVSAANITSGANTANAATNTNTVSTVVKRDSAGNFSAGTITATLLGNASTASSASNFTGSLSGDVTGTQAATTVSTVGGVSAANVASGANAALAATDSNTGSLLVKRDSSGNFSAGTVTASLTGNATFASVANSVTTFLGNLLGDVSGTQSATVASTVGGSEASAIASGANAALAATNANVANTLIRRDPSGNFSAGTLTATLSGNVTFAPVAGSASNFTASLAGNVVGTQAVTSVSTVGGVSAANISAGANAANAATNANTVSTVVKRDALGNFSAGTLTASLAGNASFVPLASTATNFSGSLVGNVTGTQAATSVSTVGGVSATNISAGANAANAATQTNTANTVVKRDAIGNFSAGTMTASLLGNATSATTTGSSSSFTGALAGNVTGTQGATTVAQVGGVTGANIASGAGLANSATSSNTVNTLVRRDGSGNFSAGTVSGTLLGNAATATIAGSSPTFSASLVGDVTGTQSATAVGSVGGVSSAGIVSALALINAATHTNTAGTLVKRDSSGGFVAGTLTASLAGTASNNTTYSANAHGVALSSASNAMTVLAPTASTAFPLISNGVGSDPYWGILGTAGGGTGSTTAAGAFSNLSPMTTLGDIITGGASGTGGRLGGNTSSTRQFLLSLGSGGVATQPSWSALQLSDIPALSYVSAVALTLPGIMSVSGSPITSSGTFTGALATQSANQIWSGPPSGGATTPTFRSLVALDLPAPSATTLGGIRSQSAVANQWINSISTAGVPTTSQPAYTDIGGTAAVTQGGTAASTMTPNALLYGSGTGAVGATAGGFQYQLFQVGVSGIPTVGALNLAQSAAVTGVLPNANTTGNSANSASALVLRNATTDFSAGTVTAALVGNVTGSVSGGILRAGDTMTGSLSLPADNLSIGGSQLIMSGGNVGIDTGSPAAELHVVSTSAATIPGIIQGAASQSANLLTLRNNSGTTLSYVGPTGVVNATPGIVIGDTMSPAAVEIQKISTQVVSVSAWAAVGATLQGVKTISFPGVATQDMVLCTPASGSPVIEAGFFHSCFVSAANTVTLTMNNMTASSGTPATRNWRITWIKQ